MTAPPNKGQVSKIVEAHLTERPSKRSLVQQGIIKDFNNADGALQSKMMSLSAKHRRDGFEKKFSSRRSRRDLVNQNILPDPSHDLGIHKAQKTLARNVAAAHISHFLSNRPSAQDLVKHKVMQDTMTWSREYSSGQVPSHRNCHTMTAVGRNLYVLGGYGNQHTFKSSELVILNIDSMAWTRPLVAGFVPSERYSHSCVAMGSSLILFGGFSVDHDWMNDLHVLDTDYKQQFIPSLGPAAKGVSKAELTQTMLLWYQPRITGEPPSPRAACSAVVRDTKIYYYGGNDGSTFYSDLYVLDTACMEWSKPTVSGDLPTARSGHTGCLVNDRTMVIFGGGNPSGFTNDVFFLDLDTMMWRCPEVHGTAPSPRAGHTATVIWDTTVLVFGGGYLSKVFNDLHMFDTETCTWSRPSDTGTVPPPRAGHSCVSIGSTVFHFGGADVDQQVFNDIYSLDTSFFRVLLPSDQVLANYSTRPVNVAPAPPLDQKSAAAAAAAAAFAASGAGGVLPAGIMPMPAASLPPPLASLANIEGKVESEFTDELLVQFEKRIMFRKKEFKRAKQDLFKRRAAQRKINSAIYSSFQANVTAQERKFSESIATIDRLWKTYQAEMESLKDLLSTHVLVPRGGTGRTQISFPPPPLKWDSSASSDQERSGHGKSKRHGGLHARTHSATTAAVLAPLANAGMGGLDPVVNVDINTRRSSAASGGSAATSASGGSSSNDAPDSKSSRPNPAPRLVSPGSTTTSLQQQQQQQQGPSSPRAMPSCAGSVSSRIRTIEALGPQPVLLPPGAKTSPRVGVGGGVHGNVQAVVINAQHLSRHPAAVDAAGSVVVGGKQRIAADVGSQTTTTRVARSPQLRRKEKSPPPTMTKMGNRMGEQSPSLRGGGHQVPPPINTTSSSSSSFDPNVIRSPRRRRRRGQPKRSYTDPPNSFQQGFATSLPSSPTVTYAGFFHQTPQSPKFSLNAYATAFAPNQTQAFVQAPHSNPHHPVMSPTTTTAHIHTRSSSMSVDHGVKSGGGGVGGGGGGGRMHRTSSWVSIVDPTAGGAAAAVYSGGPSVPSFYRQTSGGHRESFDEQYLSSDTGTYDTGSDIATGGNNSNGPSTDPNRRSERPKARRKRNRRRPAKLKKPAAATAAAATPSASVNGDNNSGDDDAKATSVSSTATSSTSTTLDRNDVASSSGNNEAEDAKDAEESVLLPRTAATGDKEEAAAAAAAASEVVGEKVVAVAEKDVVVGATTAKKQVVAKES